MELGMDYQFEVNGDRSEQVKYDTAEFPAYVRQGALSSYRDYSAVSHWHDDVELIAVVSGQMQYHINGETVTLHAGEGVFVNARQLHNGFSREKTECIYLCVLLHPLLLCSSKYVERNFVTPVLTNPAAPYCVLRGAEWEQNVLRAVREMYRRRSEKGAELIIQGLFCELWGELYAHLGREEGAAPPRSHHLTALRDMIGYIQSHYQEKISLAEICAAGGMSKTSCCAVFRKYTNRTPIACLNDYRLQKSVELMASTGLTLMEICYEAGFSGASYFAESFRKSFGCSPGQYRKRLGKKTAPES